MSALTSWATRWQGVSAHQALRGGASLHQVADAINDCLTGGNVG